MSTDRRWVLMGYNPCQNMIRMRGAGVEAVNGDYCPDGMNAGFQVWTKVGGTRLEDSLYYEADISIYIITSGGLYEPTATFAPYGVFDPPPDPPATEWHQILPLIADVDPVPTVEYMPDVLVPVKDFGPLQYARFSEEEDLSVGLIKKRRKLSVDIVFTGADFDYFRSIEKDATRRCEELIIRRQWRCDGMWKTVWTGTFSTGSGEWDLDACEFKVRPDPLDEYTCIMRAMNKRVNVMDVEPFTISAVIVPPGIEFGYCNLLDLGGCSSIYNAGAGWELAHTYFDAVLGRNVNLYWRERIITNCVAGSPVPPPGAGWILLYDNCAGLWSHRPCDFYPLEGQSVYVREPTIPYTFGDPVYDPDETCGFPIFAGSSYNGNLFDNVCSTDVVGNIYVCLGAGDVTEYERARKVLSCLDYLLEKSGCDSISVVSDFFEWNPIGDAPGYVAGENYVTGETNQMDQLVLLQKSDAIDPLASNPATLGEMTLKDMLTLFAVAFRVFWEVTDDGEIRFEHWSFWATPVGLNVATYATDDKSEPLSYAYLKTDIPRYERPKWAEALGLDFVGVDIEYDSLCANSEEGQDVKEYNPGAFTTDLSFIASDPDAISKQGFALLATAFDGTDYNVILDEGAITLSFVTNAPLSWANLERDFWQHDRFMPTGTMNRVLTEFLGFLPNIEQRNVFLKFCCDYADFDSSERVSTKLGFKLGGINAFIRRAEFDEATDGLTLTLRYAY